MLLAQLRPRLVREVDGLEQVRRMASAPIIGGEAVVAVLLLGVTQVLLLRQELVRSSSGSGPARVTHVGFEVQDPLEVLQRHVQHQADAAGQRLQEPDVSDRAASSMWPMRSRRTRASVTSTPHFSQMTPLYFMRLYLPHRHS